MNYSKEQLKSIEKVKTIFEGYLKDCWTLDLLWSDKIGYLLVTGITKDKNNIVMHPEIIHDGERLCEQLLYEIACDVLSSNGNFHDIYESSPLEKELILKAYHPYMIQLPEYSDLIERHFICPEDR